MHDHKPEGPFDGYSDRFLELASDTDHAGIPEDYDATGGQTGQCGDTVSFYLKTNGDTITEARFAIDGCMNTLACANAVVFLIGGRTIDEAWEVNEHTIAEELHGIPEDHFHCAELAAGALYKALRNLNTVRRDPWKKPYQKK
ncbi:MAG: iron-sulfur cluster assembly scaffold protein [Desulfatibacillaceae bacterium]